MQEPRRQYRQTFIRDWRKSKSLSIERLAEKIGVSGASLSRIERGEQPYSQPFMEATAEALGVGVDTLIGGPPCAKSRILELVEGMSEAEKEQAERILMAMRGKA